MDLSPDTLDFLTHLMCAQARECLFEKNELGLYDEDEAGDRKKKASDIDKFLNVGQEAAYVSRPWDVYFCSNFDFVRIRLCSNVDSVLILTLFE